MRIGIDIRAACTQHKAGKGWYTYHLVENLLKTDHKNEYLLYTEEVQMSNVKAQNLRFKVLKKNPAIWHWAVARDFAKENGDVFFAPVSFIIPALLPSHIKLVVTVHDLVSFLFPLRHQAKAVILENFLLKKVLKKNPEVIVPSENTKRDLVKLFNYDEQKIHITPLAASETFAREPKGLKAFAGKWDLPEKFLLCVGTLEPRKNLPFFLDVMLNVISSWPGNPAINDINIVIVGREGWKSNEIFKMMKKLGHRMIFLPYLSKEDLAKIYRLAYAFIFPSLYEGFGIPPLEAMASGCPVLCSNAASLPEVVDEAALLFDPSDRKSLETQIMRIFQNPDLREELIRRGKEQAKKFSWKMTAGETLAVILSLSKDDSHGLTPRQARGRLSSP